MVQGVGFRPFVYNLARRYALSGWVLNSSGGVVIEVEGAEEALSAFGQALSDEAPPLAHVESVTVTPAEPTYDTGFEIRASQSVAGAYQLVSPDVATCPDCLREVLDPADRRYRYPFTNCTNCGPRFTIITSLPYDRPDTTMRRFRMCPACQREYEDPTDRRFHAQPNACPVCGPHLELVPGTASPPEGKGIPPSDVGDPLTRASDMLRAGAIIALKGLGGFQLACNATNARAVAALRRRKRRPHKAFALMMATMDDVRRYCFVSQDEEALLTSPQAPIVLLKRREGGDIAESVAPNNLFLGVMLPYTPLHHILLRDTGRPLVMTSGNLSEEPIVGENEGALAKLAPLADALLLHNRDIHARYDDSVWFVGRGVQGSGRAQPVRRARGYAPFPITLPFDASGILGCGAEIKNTFCLTRDRYAFLSQHIGDMDSLETLEHYERTYALYEMLFDIHPQVVAVDPHPDYRATRFGQGLAQRDGLQVVEVQHHHAHLASCLSDNGWPADAGPVIGVSLDGTGYGADGHIWGGEWLVGDYARCERMGHLEYLPLPGGDAATWHPWRIAAAYLHELIGSVPEGLVPPDTPTMTLDLLRRLVDRRLNCPLTSSMGRLYDAVSALVGVRKAISYEGQAAMELEMLAMRAEQTRALAPYPVGVERPKGAWIVRLRPLFEAILGDLCNQQDPAVIARRFQRTVAAVTVDVCRRIATERGLNTVALSGGCFQNRMLLADVIPALEQEGFQVLTHHQVPCNDGGLSLGQVAVAHQTRE